MRIVWVVRHHDCKSPFPSASNSNRRNCVGDSNRGPTYYEKAEAGRGAEQSTRSQRIQASQGTPPLARIVPSGASGGATPHLNAAPSRPQVVATVLISQRMSGDAFWTRIGARAMLPRFTSASTVSTD